MTTPQRLRVAIPLIALGALTGCASADANPSESSKELPPVSSAGYEKERATLDLTHAIATTPVDRIAFQTPERDAKFFHAVAVRADECMAKQGLPTIASKTDWSPRLPLENREYGLWGIEYASKYGVELASNTGPQEVDTLSFGTAFNKAYNSCTESAKASLKGPIAFNDSPQIDYKIRFRSYELTLASGAGKKALASWRACMESEGVVLDPSDGRPSPQYKAQSKEAEIRVSVIEAKCGVETGAVQALYDTQAQYEAAYLDAQAAQVKAFVAKRDKVERELDDVIAGR